MQTYGNFMSAKPYRPHLDSSDFMDSVRLGALVAYGLSIAFSVRGNYKGLLQTLEKDPGAWLLVIAVGITLTGAVLSMLTVLRIKGLSRGGRRFVFLGVAGFLMISTSLNLIGFTAGEETQKTNAVQQHPDVKAANRELDEIVKRQQQYGISEQEKASLLKREKEQREWVRQVEMRVWKEMGSGSLSTAEKALGEHAATARLLFAIAPELAIIALGPVIVLLWGFAGVSEGEIAAAGAPQIVYVTAPGGAVQPSPAPNEALRFSPPLTKSSNGRPEQPTYLPAPAEWNPF